MLPKSFKNLCQQRSDARHQRGLSRVLREVERVDAAHLKRHGKALINFASNDYLGLSTHSAVKEAAQAAAKKYGVGSGASRLVSGTHTLHTELETRIAQHRGAESCLLFTTGYQANAGTLAAIADHETLIVSDELNHASIVDGCRLARARIGVFAHKDYSDAADKLAQPAPRKILVSDTIFSMGGDIAEIKPLVELAREFDALLMLDDAHGYGVLGGQGRGALEAQGLDEHDVGIVTGTLSKALGSLGGFVCACGDLRELLLNDSRAFMFSTAGSLPDIAAAIAALDIVESEEGRKLREHLKALHERVRESVRKIGFETDGSTQIVPVFLDDNARAVEASKAFEARGLLVPAIRAPAAPRGRAMLRVSLSAAHSDADVEALLDALRMAAGAL